MSSNKHTKKRKIDSEEGPVDIDKDVKTFDQTLGQLQGIREHNADMFLGALQSDLPSYFSHLPPDAFAPEFLPFVLDIIKGTLTLHFRSMKDDQCVQELIDTHTETIGHLLNSCVEVVRCHQSLHPAPASPPLAGTESSSSSSDSAASTTE